ncbi:MAG: DMT family transporter [Proteobacteria bacterium]|nr:DMT family transporter [Pseudomonadota bacterium]
MQHETQLPHVGRGRLIFAAALTILPFMDAIAKLLSARLPVLEITWARFVVYAAIVVPAALARHGPRGLVPRHPGWQLVRGACTGLSSAAFFVAVSRMPVADSMAIFLIYPAILLCLSTLLLGERPSPRTWLLVGCGFLGALLVVRPTFSGLADGAGYALASACLYAIGMITTRRLADEASSLITTAISALMGAVAFSVAVPFVWVRPAPADLPLLLLVGLIAAAGHYGIVAAHRDARAADLAPLGYTEIAGAVVAGALLFGVLPTELTWIGIGLIVSSGIAVSWRIRR